MVTVAPEQVVNRLIAELPRKEGKIFLTHCEPVDLHCGTILCEPDKTFQYIYFPLTGFISQVVAVDDHQPLEMGLIGNEGMLGATLALGVNTAPLRAIVQGSGTALRMSVANLRVELRDSAALLATLKRYVYVLMAQLSQAVVCSRFHETEPRLARWLLMTHDCAHADHFLLTHKFLADMLGVQRSAITIAAGSLQRSKLIRYTRGRITILDRNGLEAIACECYDALIGDYRRQFH